jgi:FOG: FHA domain
MRAGLLLGIMAMSVLLLAQGAQAPNFYIVNVQGQQTTTFYPGDVVMLRVAPFGTFAGKLAIYYIGPTGAQSQPQSYVYCGSNVLSTTQDIQVLPVTQQTLTGKYTLYIAVYDCANNPVRTIQLEFYVTSQSTSASPPPASAIDPTLVMAIIALIAALVGVGLTPAGRRALQRWFSQTVARRQPQFGIGGGGTRVGSPIAFLVLPNGYTIPIAESSVEFGRDHFKPYLPPDTVKFISVRHFRIYYVGGQWYIEDLGSTNGTLLNGQEIRKKGPVPLKPGDVISPAGAINLVFKPS